jgi:beta-galactosidase
MWHRDKDETALACYTAMYHDMMRSLKGGKPFVLMESTPSATNWQPTSKLKKPGMHILSSAGGGARRRLGAVLPVAEKPRFG